MMRNKIRLEDFKLRLFIDTNVLIDYIEGFDKKQSVAFLNLFRSKFRKKAKINDIELVTSDYVLWEFYGHSKEELYVQKLVKDHSYGYIAANKECRNGSFRHADLLCMRKFGKEIKEKLERIKKEEIIYPESLVGKNIPGFSEVIEDILCSSKFSYKDAIVLASAYFTQAHILITRDEQHFSQSRIDDLEGAIKSWVKPSQIKIMKPSNFDTLDKVKREYKKWFCEQNSNKVIGKVIKHFPKKNVIEIKCKKGCAIKEGDFIYIVKFFNKNDIGKFCFQIPKKNGNFKDARTKKPIIKGEHITVKIPSRYSYGKQKRWKDAWAFIATL